MRRTLLALIVCLPALACSAARPPEGRWEGRVEIPGSELQLIVDLAQGSAGGWAGSIVIPGLGIKGAALSNVVVTDTDVAFDIGKVLGTPTHGPAGFRAHLIAADGMAGEMRQAGNVAKFALTKIGPGPGRIVAAKHGGPSGARGPMDRRIRARRLSAPRHDHPRKSRGCRGERQIRHRRQDDQ